MAEIPTRKRKISFSKADIDKCKELLSKGDTLVRKKDFSKAICEYDAFLEIVPNDARVFARRSQCYFKLRRLENAIADAKKAVIANPNVAKFWYRAGQTYKEMHQYSKAVAAYCKALLSPEMADDEKWRKNLERKRDVCIESYRQQCLHQMTLTDAKVSNRRNSGCKLNDAKLIEMITIAFNKQFRRSMSCGLLFKKDDTSKSERLQWCEQVLNDASYFKHHAVYPCKNGHHNDKKRSSMSAASSSSSLNSAFSDDSSGSESENHCASANNNGDADDNGDANDASSELELKTQLEVADTLSSSSLPSADDKIDCCGDGVCHFRFFDLGFDFICANLVDSCCDDRNDLIAQRLERWLDNGYCHVCQFFMFEDDLQYQLSQLKPARLDDFQW